jgi:DNA-binding XRE family transcriptional regulator
MLDGRRQIERYWRLTPSTNAELHLMATSPPSLAALFTRAHYTLRLTQEEIGQRLGFSKRTAQRIAAGRSRPSNENIQRLADMVRSEDAALAAELDRWAPRPKPPPPLVVAQPPPPPPAPPPIPVAVLVESVVCAAADAMGLVPQAVRPALLAAFARASEARLAPEEVVAVLSPRPTALGKGDPSSS